MATTNIIEKISERVSHDHAFVILRGFRTLKWLMYLLVLVASSIAVVAMSNRTGVAIALILVVVSSLTFVKQSKVLNSAIEQLNDQACRDSLTGIYNRREFERQFQAQMSRMGRRTRTPTLLSLLLIDIDHFKRINDGFGHDAGDAVLREVARLIGETLRPLDIFARLGGEEFAILMEHTERVTAAQVAERIRSVIQSVGIAHEKHEIHLTVTVGYCTTDSLTEWKRCYSEADEALYCGKNAGRNVVKGTTLFSRLNDVAAA